MALYKLFQQWQQFFGETMFIALFTVVLTLLCCVLDDGSVLRYGYDGLALGCLLFSAIISRFVKP